MMVEELVALSRPLEPKHVIAFLRAMSRSEIGGWDHAAGAINRRFTLSHPTEIYRAALERLGGRISEISTVCRSPVGDPLLAASASAAHTRLLYESTGLAATDDVVFINLGYTSLAPNSPPFALDPADEAERPGIALYRQTIGDNDLRGRQVVEVGCGRGGGTSYVRRYHEPAFVRGIDFSESHIEFCRQRHSLAGLAFTLGSATDLPLPSASIDALLSVESSHGYPAMETFLGEAARVLRPGGRLLFSDLRTTQRRPKVLSEHVATIDTLREQLSRSPFKIVREEEITANVVRAIELSEQDKLRQYRNAPGVRVIFGTEGDCLYADLVAGAVVYMTFTLER
jgi:fatty-acid O-methyltransferase